jgi:hypothetical protein
LDDFSQTLGDFGRLGRFFTNFGRFGAILGDLGDFSQTLGDFSQTHPVTLAHDDSVRFGRLRQHLIQEKWPFRKNSFSSESRQWLLLELVTQFVSHNFLCSHFEDFLCSQF